MTKQAVTEWRAPKLVGVSVYGVDDKKVGTIKDVLMDHDGSARVIVIGVGELLGIERGILECPSLRSSGKPRAALYRQWTSHRPTRFPRTNSESNQPTLKKTDPAATEASQGYPDKAVLRVTSAQLKMAPDFKYAPDPLAKLDPSSGRPQSTNQ